MRVCIHAPTCGSLRRWVLSAGLSPSPGQKLGAEEDSQPAAASWQGPAIPSSVTRQHYQRCCTCAPDINYHFLFSFMHFTEEPWGFLERTRVSLKGCQCPQPAQGCWASRWPARSCPAPAPLNMAASGLVWPGRCPGLPALTLYISHSLHHSIKPSVPQIWIALGSVEILSELGISPHERVAIQLSRSVTLSGFDVRNQTHEKPSGCC